MVSRAEELAVTDTSVYSVYNACTWSSSVEEMLCTDYWQYVAIVVVLWHPASGVVGVVVIVVVGVYDHSQMRTSKCTCLIFGMNI